MRVMSNRALWIVLILLVVGTIALIPLGYFLLSNAMALAAVILGVYLDNRRKTDRRQRFTAEFGSAERIRATHDLARFRRIGEEAGRVHAVREIRRAIPGISLTEAVELLDGPR